MDILTKVPEPAQIGILLNLDLETVITLVEGRTQLGDLIRSPYFLKDLALVHNLPIPKDWDQFLEFIHMTPDQLLEYSASIGLMRVIEDIIDTSSPYNLNGYVAMESALNGGYSGAFKHIAEKLAPPNSSIWVGILSCAGRKGHIGLIQNLMELLRSRISTGEYQESLGMAASQASGAGHLEVVKLLVPFLDQEGLEWALSWAASSNRMEIVQFLRESGARDYNRAMAGAAGAGLIGMVQFFLDLEADDLYAALGSAADNNRLSMAKFLIDLGANDLDEALYRAAVEGHLEMVKFLVEKGATNLKETMETIEDNGEADVVEFLKAQIERSG